jgi:hypothetical protein
VIHRKCGGPASPSRNTYIVAVAGENPVSYD